MTNRTISVDCCLQCPLKGEFWNLCKHPNSPGQNRTPLSGIPDWCPLPKDHQSELLEALQTLDSLGRKRSECGRLHKCDKRGSRRYLQGHRNLA